MKITCPFCYAQVLGIEIPQYCPHCGTKFKEEDDLQPKTPREVDNEDREKFSWMKKSLKLEIR